MPRPPALISSIARRLPEAGRIRIGVKTRNAMKLIDTFRFTSQDKQSIQQVADLYGGTVKPWSDPKAVGGQWEVITEANELRVALPPDPLGGTPVYEMWGGGGCERRCDGETCERFVQSGDGIDLEDGPCICAGKGVLECKPITRISILLPEIRFIGVWRLDTKSMNAAQELPGMVDMIQALQAKGIVRGLLRVERREQRIAGRTNKFVVPVLGLDASVEQLAAGSAAIGQIGAAPADLPALSAGSVVPDEPEFHDQNDEDDGTTYDHGTDDDVVDAEVVDEPVVIEGREVLPSNDPPPAGKMRKLFALLSGNGIGEDLRHQWASNQLQREITSFDQLTTDDADRLIGVLTEAVKA